MAALKSANVLILPGWSDSGPQHWQTLWAEAYSFSRLSQRDWFQPSRDEWLAALDGAVAAAPAGVVLVAHSLACALVSHFSQRPAAARVKAALLVAPADVEAPGTPADIRNFAPLPMGRFPFPAVLVGSRNDPFCTLERAGALADRWGARFIDAGMVGHLNVDAGFGPWPYGERLLESLLA